MKTKILIISVLMTSMLYSCRGGWECQCTGGAGGDYTKIESSDLSAKKAEEWCDDIESSVTGNECILVELEFK